MEDFLVQLQAEYEKISQNQIGRFEPGFSAEQFISQFKEKVETLKILHMKMENLLRDNLYPMLQNIANISDGDEAELFATAQMLASYEARLDPSLALKIYKGLLERARSLKDDAKIIRYVYWCGITSFFFASKTEQRAQTSGEGDAIMAYFEEGASYAGRYHSFGDQETRQYIHRCLGNRSMICYDHDPQKAMAMEEADFAFWNELIATGVDLEFPWFYYVVTCLSRRHSYLIRGFHDDPDSETKEHRKMILDNAISINRLYWKNRESFSVFGGARYEFLLWEAQFLNGLISFEHFCENVCTKRAEFAPADTSADALYIRVTATATLMFYAVRLQRLKGIKDEILSRFSKELTEYFTMLPISENPEKVSSQIISLAENLSGIFTPTEQIDFIIKMTTYRHIPTYAHSAIVGKIASCLTKRLVESNPGAFAGFLDIGSAGDASARKDEICRFAETGGLCHDVGKLLYVGNPFLHARRLTDEDFGIVKRHPAEGAQMLARDDEEMISSSMIDVIEGHHRFYDGSGGYPEGLVVDGSKNRIMVDIMAVANSIESATDDIGKTFGEVKTLERVCAEIREEAGTRYSPIVSAALDDIAVIAELGRILKQGRRDAYYTAYLNTWGSGDSGGTGL